jgi:hypothetical protein
MALQSVRRGSVKPPESPETPAPKGIPKVLIF